MTIIPCPLCAAPLKNSPQKVPAINRSFDVTYFDCPCCGKFGMQSIDMDSRISNLTETERATLATCVYAHFLEDKEAVILWRALQISANSRGEVWIEFSRIMKEFPLPPITERFDRVLLNLSKTHKPGQMIKLGEHHLGLFCAEDTTTALFIVEALTERGYLQGGRTLPGNFKITVEGWIRIAELNRGSLGKENRQVFVAMWFDTKMDSAFYNGITPAIKDAGFTLFRVDKAPSNNQITDEIVAGIRRSKFMVADCTGHRPAVYYEAGLMHGLGRPVIFTCKADELTKASFDTNHYPHITWKTPEELKDKLLHRIQATITD